MNINFSEPIRLQSSRAWRTYLGGKLISALHGIDDEDTHFPEEWLMSAVSARNSGREHIIEGLSYVAGTDITLADLLKAHSHELLGTTHANTYGQTLGVLVKLLDAAERLTLQVHPTKECAQKLFNSQFGKTECWHIIGEREINGEKPCMYIGFREGVTREKWEQAFKEQNIPAMLACLHKIPVKKGDTFIIRGGVPHGIGAGCFLIEIQEPTDYTIRTERVTPSGLSVDDYMCHQGLGFQKMFDCFEYNGLSLKETLSRYRITPKSELYNGYSIQHIIYPKVTDLFALQLITVERSVTLETNDRFYGIYVMSGEGKLNGTDITVCDHYFVPASCHNITVEAIGNKPLCFMRCFGPMPTPTP